jgi:hypothetical protein
MQKRKTLAAYLRLDGSVTNGIAHHSLTVCTFNLRIMLGRLVALFAPTLPRYDTPLRLRHEPSQNVLAQFQPLGFRPLNHTCRSPKMGRARGTGISKGEVKS